MDVSRGALNDTEIIKGSEISDIGRSSFSHGGAEIPYHRVIRISHEDTVLFEKPDPWPDRQMQVGKGC